MRYLIVILLLASCSPQKRLARLLDKHPELVDSFKTEVTINRTITEIDTFTIPGDTIAVAYEVLKRDTVFTKGRVTLVSRGGQISAYTQADTLYQMDTIRFSETIIVPGKMIKKPWRAWEYFVFWLPLILLSVILVNRARKL